MSNFTPEQYEVALEQVLTFAHKHLDPDSSPWDSYVVDETAKSIVRSLKANPLNHESGHVLTRDEAERMLRASNGIRDEEDPEEASEIVFRYIDSLYGAGYVIVKKFDEGWKIGDRVRAKNTAYEGIVTNVDRSRRLWVRVKFDDGYEGWNLPELLEEVRS